MMQRWRNVQFEFVSLAGDTYAYSGTVIARDGEMVLELECPGERPYLIPGQFVWEFFQGARQGPPGDAPVTAKWIRLDDIYVGMWIEEGIDYLFIFRLPVGAESD